MAVEHTRQQSREGIGHRVKRHSSGCEIHCDTEGRSDCAACHDSAAQRAGHDDKKRREMSERYRTEKLDLRSCHEQHRRRYEHAAVVAQLLGLGRALLIAHRLAEKPAAAEGEHRFHKHDRCRRCLSEHRCKAGQYACRERGEGCGARRKYAAFCKPCVLKSKAYRIDQNYCGKIAYTSGKAAAYHIADRRADKAANAVCSRAGCRDRSRAEGSCSAEQPCRGKQYTADQMHDGIGRAYHLRRAALRRAFVYRALYSRDRAFHVHFSPPQVYIK